MYSVPSANWVIQDARWESLTPLQRCSRCILPPQPTRPPRTHLRGGLTPLQRCSRCILHPQPMGHLRHSFGGVTPLQKCSRCILKSQPTGPSRTLVGGGVLPSTEMHPPSQLGHPGHSLRGVYPPCRDPAPTSQLGHQLTENLQSIIANFCNLDSLNSFLNHQLSHFFLSALRISGFPCFLCRLFGIRPRVLTTHKVYHSQHYDPYFFLSVLCNYSCISRFL